MRMGLILSALSAHQEGTAERHIRYRMPLAFVSPRIVTAIMDGTAQTIEK
jgi:hypothetical protein